MGSVRTALGVASGLALLGCAAPPSDIGPLEYDASGTMPCSAVTPTFHSTCGWRVLRPAQGAAEIWISNPAISDRPAYRVLYYLDGDFTDRDGAALEVSQASDTWTVAVPNQEYYRFADALITGG